MALATRNIRNRLSDNLMRKANLSKENSMRLSTIAKYAIIITKAAIVWGGSNGDTGMNTKGSPINPRIVEATFIISEATGDFFQLISKNL